MVRVEDEIFIRAPRDLAFECFWDATLWPRITPHVKKIEMLENGAGRQRFRMTVESQGRLHTVESVRTAEGQRRITYDQTTPPVFLKRHSGEWLFDEVDDGVRIRLIHRAELDPEKLEALDAATIADGEEAVARNLGANGMRTMQAVKAHLEQ